MGYDVCKENNVLVVDDIDTKNGMWKNDVVNGSLIAVLFLSATIILR